MYDELIIDLVDKLSKLPGIGPKSATRLAFFILETDSDYVKQLVAAIINAKKNVNFCEMCGNTTQGQICAICSNPSRDKSIICVVEEPRDLIAIEKTHQFTGLYHVLGGALNPLQGIGVEDLRIELLMKRLGDVNVQEIIMATNPNVEGEATAAYLARLIQPMNIKVTRIAQGLPIGGDLEYADEMTLGQAVVARRPFNDSI
ncbi:MAG: recombination mediator RecR [Candidatus Ancillula sp.]|jgi:recombination protein RecR|nr:recombination mediator RecR [Candidatus Ancillula sp.]